MRKWITTIAVAVLALALAGVALAKFSQVAKITLTAHKAGQSTGINADIHSSDPAALGQKPRAATKLVHHVPGGTKFNLRTPLRTSCTLTDRQLSDQFGPSCPSKSLIGTGTAGVNAMPITPPPNGTGQGLRRRSQPDRPGDQADAARLRLEDHRDPRHRCGPDDDDSGSAALDRRVRGQPPTEVR